ncbi:hypothetical protein F5Y14DRAFT_112696 [Nemania sp. NC0429]|nr:hypothetical protein F5Y14DRAFT_112696 [Nemania sp. NC0429]
MTPLVTTTTRKRFACPDCSAEFSRKDHAKRHKLSHRRPEFACPHPDCGLFFHRLDVLRRHEAVHRPENAEKRRRPRRGPLPPALPSFRGQEQQQQPLSVSGSHEARREVASVHGLARSCGHSDPSDLPDGVTDDWNNRNGEEKEGGGEGIEESDEATCSCHVDNGTVCVACSAELIRLADGRIPPGSEGVIKFCTTHYIQSQLKWFPFIRSSSLRVNWLASGRALVLAALGARGIKEYKSLAEDLWREAVRRTEPWVLSSSSSSPPSPSPDVLWDFQTKILLVEYLQWLEVDKLPAWVEPMLGQMANGEARVLVNMLAAGEGLPESAADGSVERELCREEIRWTLWKFYCVLTQTSLLGIKLHPPRLFQALDLPGEPEQLLAMSQSLTREDDGLAASMRSERRGRGLTLPRAITALLADDHRRDELPDMLSMTGRYIVLHTISYLLDYMVDEEVDAETAKGDLPGWRIETRGRLHRLVMRWRQCFWTPPEVLWNKPFPEFGSLQSVMFVVYLSVRVSQPIRRGSPGGEGKTARSSLQPYVQYAMRCIVAIHMNMRNNNLLEVAAKGRWFLDGATWRRGGLTAKYAVEWLRDRASFGSEDEDIDFLHSLESVMAFYSYAGSYDGLSNSPARVAQLERSLTNLWTMILGTDSWLESPSEVLC